MKIKPIKHVKITGRGDVILISLKDQGWSNDVQKSEVYDLLGKEVELDTPTRHQKTDRLIYKIEVRKLECARTLTTSPVLMDRVGIQCNIIWE